MKAETCEICGRDLPDSEWCDFCGHNNHKPQLSGWALKRIRNEIKDEQDKREN